MSLFNTLTACAMDETFTPHAETNPLEQNPSFKAASLRVSEYFNEITPSVDNHPALIGIVNTYRDMIAITEDIAYRQGFADGLRFLTSGLSWTARDEVVKP